MATRAKGYLAGAAFKKGSVWETPVAAGAGDGFPILNEGLVSNIDLQRDESFNGSPFQYPGEAGNETIEGPLGVNLRYFDKSLNILAILMGAAGVTGTGPWVSHLTMAAENDGEFGTLVINRQFEVWEYGNVKPLSFELSADPENSFIPCTFEFNGYSRNINTSTGTNTTTTWGTVTDAYTAKDDLRYGHCAILMNDADAGALSGSDALCVSEFTFNVARAAESDRTTCTLGKYNEPSDNGFATVSGSMTIPAYEDGHRTLIADAQAKTVKKMSIIFAKDANSIFAFYFPAIQLTNDGPFADQPGKLPFTLNFDSFRRPEGAPTGMTEDNFYIDVTTNDANADTLNLLTWA